MNKIVLENGKLMQ
jgi:predicted house-cleaning noncanonical NTP pyrophosphatase (MazG superfamily)